MKFKKIIESYLLTEGRTKRISKAKTKELILNNCQDILDMSKPNSISTSIYRGNEHAPLYGYVNPKQYNREWDNNNSAYNLIIDNTTQWNQFPKRGHGIICTSSHKTSSEYGTPHYVFPFDDAKLGICPKSDIWHSFPKIQDFLISASVYSRCVSVIIEAVLSEKPEHNSFSQFKNQTSNINLSDLESLNKSDLKSHTHFLMMNAVRNIWRQSYQNIENLFDFSVLVVSPDAFDVETTKSISSKELRGQEIWTDSECVIVECEAWDDGRVI